jgi:hypothetical protein
MNDNVVKDLLAQVLEANDFHVTKLPRREDSRTADLLVRDSDDRYFIEVKSKADDEQRLLEMDAALTHGSLRRPPCRELDVPIWNFKFATSCRVS